MEISRNILIAPLNWGLGHATRCIPIINALLQEGFTPILASDGAALDLLQKEFPDLLSLELPSYHISYPKTASLLKLKMLMLFPTILSAVSAERKLVAKWVSEYNLIGIISDNRFGVYNKNMPSVYITHQLTVLSGNTTQISTLIHRKLISKFDECWVPDIQGEKNLSGILGHIKNTSTKVKHIGMLSRFRHSEGSEEYDLMILLSGPEPHRTMLENKLRTEALKFKGNVLMICGKVQEKQSVSKTGNITIYNFMLSHELENAIKSSDLILCRSGYSTLMDLARLEKKAFLIPTPSQFEQEYLAKRMKEQGLAPYTTQNKFVIADLLQTTAYSGLSESRSEIALADLFVLFKGK